MIPDTDNTFGMAALFVTSDGPCEHGFNFVLYTDGTGAYGENIAGGDWQAWDALPTENVTTLNEGTGEYETVRTLSIDIADVAEWSPWTIYMTDGTWYFRSNAFGPWEEAASSEQAAANPTHPPVIPPDFELPL